MTVTHGVCFCSERRRSVAVHERRAQTPVFIPATGDERFRSWVTFNVLGRSRVPPGFGYRFVAQARQHSGHSIDRGRAVIGRAPPVARVCGSRVRSAGTGRQACRNIADTDGKYSATGIDRSKSCAPSRAMDAAKNAVETRMPGINPRRAVGKTDERVTTGRFLTESPRSNREMHTFA